MTRQKRWNAPIGARIIGSALGAACCVSLLCLSTPNIAFAAAPGAPGVGAYVPVSDLPAQAAKIRRLKKTPKKPANMRKRAANPNGSGVAGQNADIAVSKGQERKWNPDDDENRLVRKYARKNRPEEIAVVPVEKKKVSWSALDEDVPDRPDWKRTDITRAPSEPAPYGKAKAAVLPAAAESVEAENPLTIPAQGSRKVPTGFVRFFPAKSGFGDGPGMNAQKGNLTRMPGGEQVDVFLDARNAEDLSLWQKLRADRDTNAALLDGRINVWIPSFGDGDVMPAMVFAYALSQGREKAFDFIDYIGAQSRDGAGNLSEDVKAKKLEAAMDAWMRKSGIQPDILYKDRGVMIRTAKGMDAQRRRFVAMGGRRNGRLAVYVDGKENSGYFESILPVSSN